MSKFSKTIRTIIIVFTVLIAMALIFDAVTYRPDYPEFYALDISMSEIIETYEQYDFTFSETSELFGYPMMVGFSPYRFQVIQILGTEDEVVAVRMASLLTEDMTKSDLTAIRSEMELMFKLILPSWSGSALWFKNKSLDIGNDGSRSTVFEGTDVRVTLRDSDNTFGVSFGAWEGIPDMNKDHLWLINEW